VHSIVAKTIMCDGRATSLAGGGRSHVFGASTVWAA